MQDKVAEEPVIDESLRLTGSRPTLERIRIEAQEAAARQRRRVLATRIASVVVVLSLAVIGYALLGG